MERHAINLLPVRQRIEFKMAVLVYKALHGLSPQYLADDCQVITTTGCWRLQSSTVATCDVPRTCWTLCDRSFTAAGPHLWNSLPLHLRDFELSLLEFRWLLKTHLFDWRSRRLVTYFRCSALYKCPYLLTYLLTQQTKEDSRRTMDTSVFHNNLSVEWSAA